MQGYFFAAPVDEAVLGLTRLSSESASSLVLGLVAGCGPQVTATINGVPVPLLAQSLQAAPFTRTMDISGKAVGASMPSLL